MDFGDRLRLVRVKHGKRLRRKMTQDEFAFRIHQSPSAYKQWEAGNNMPEKPVDVAKMVERETGAPAAWLLGVMPPDGTSDQGIHGRAWETDNVRLFPRKLAVVGSRANAA